ncbi:MAG: DegV family protein [Coriobacteriia bacterium]|nr:DegV family protein [Coriobacteriia bacterium]
MSNIALSADSTCDLSSELKDEYNVVYYPYCIILGDKEYRDNVDIHPSDIYKAYHKDGSLPKTAAISVGEYLEHFKKLKESHDEVIHITLGHALSSACDNAKSAAEQLDGVYVVDSCNLSTGTGQLVIRAGRMIKDGMDAKSIVSELEKIKEHVHVSFVLDTLDFMAAGGRCPTVAAKAAGMLKCKPLLNVDNSDGSLHMGKMYRGKLKKVLLKYIGDQLSQYDDVVPDDVFVTNSAELEDDILEAVKAEVRKYVPFERVHETVASCTISSHCGPRCFGILFVTKWD